MRGAFDALAGRGNAALDEDGRIHTGERLRPAMRIVYGFAGACRLPPVDYRPEPDDDGCAVAPCDAPSTG